MIAAQKRNLKKERIKSEFKLWPSNMLKIVKMKDIFLMLNMKKDDKTIAEENTVTHLP